MRLSPRAQRTRVPGRPRDRTLRRQRRAAARQRSGDGGPSGPRRRRRRGGGLRSLGQVFANTRTKMFGDEQRKTLPGRDREIGAPAGGLARWGGARKRVPEQRRGSRAPLLLEAIGAGAARRSAEVEGTEALVTCGPQSFPIQEHVRTR